MEITGYFKGYATKTVHVAGAEEETDFNISAFAMERANETRSSLFGWTIRWVDDFSSEVSRRIAVVSLHTD